MKYVFSIILITLPIYLFSQEDKVAYIDVEWIIDSIVEYEYSKIKKESENEIALLDSLYQRKINAAIEWGKKYPDSIRYSCGHRTLNDYSDRIIDRKQSMDKFLSNYKENRKIELKKMTLQKISFLVKNECYDFYTDISKFKPFSYESKDDLTNFIWQKLIQCD